MCDEARSQYELMNCKNNPKTFWQYVKKKDVSTLEDNHGQLITSDITKAKLLNKYFLSVFIKDTDINFVKLNVNHPISDTIYINFYFSTVFHVIFNKSLNEGLLPKQWKPANVKALFKKGKRTQCSNHRPVQGRIQGGGVGDVRTPPQISPKCPFHKRISMMIHQVSTYQRCLWIMSI